MTVLKRSMNLKVGGESPEERLAKYRDDPYFAYLSSDTLERMSSVGNPRVYAGFTDVTNDDGGMVRTFHIAPALINGSEGVNVLEAAEVILIQTFDSDGNTEGWDVMFPRGFNPLRAKTLAAYLDVLFDGFRATKGGYEWSANFHPTLQEFDERIEYIRGLGPAQSWRLPREVGEGGHIVKKSHSIPSRQWSLSLGGHTWRVECRGRNPDTIVGALIGEFQKTGNYPEMGFLSVKIGDGTAADLVESGHLKIEDVTPPEVKDDTSDSETDD